MALKKVFFSAVQFCMSNSYVMPVVHECHVWVVYVTGLFIEQNYTKNQTHKKGGPDLGIYMPKGQMGSHTTNKDTDRFAYCNGVSMVLGV